MVRFEYSVAEREVISVSSARHSCAMFIVTGQPGIGALAPFFSPTTRRDQRPLRKDRDFTLLLMRRRAYRLTTVLQVEPRLCNPLSREWRLLVYTVREQPSLHLALHLHSCEPDLGPRCHEPNPPGTRSHPQVRLTFLCGECDFLSFRPP